MVYRVFVEKKPGLSPECGTLLNDCRAFLGLTGVEKVRIWNRYDAEGLDEALFERAKQVVFSEPPLDVVSDAPETAGAAAVFAVEPLPGQFDQRADSAAQCIQLLSQGERPAVRTAKIYALYGTLTAEDAARCLEKAGDTCFRVTQTRTDTAGAFAAVSALMCILAWYSISGLIR